MRPPRLPANHPDYVIDLEEQMEAQLVALMDLASDRGWDQATVAAAVASLAQNYVKMLEANLQTEIDIAKAMRLRRHLH
jgi:hypothetical protein